MNRLLQGPLLSILLLGLLGACSPFGGSAPPEAPGGSGSREVVIRVENQHWNDIVVYAVRGGMSRRLGQVTTNRTVDFDVPANFVLTGGVVWLRAEVIGSSSTLVTDPLYLDPGDVVRWTIMNLLSQSHYEIL